MNGDQIRDSFIKFFEGKGHQHMPSASLIPSGDPTLLFTSAGMVPFKPFFMGEQTPPSRRLTSSQKSFRTTDIDEVGDHKHLTFFEMLGNFSIGDYFKEGAIAYAWELVTQLFKLPPDRLFVTVHLDDDEAFRIWRDQAGVPADRIYRYGDSDNWWGPAGTEGPTGPCSEIHYDGGAEKGCGPLVAPDVLTDQLREERATGEKKPVPGCHPNCDCERFVELWNLVFMQYYQSAEGGQRNRTPLPAPSVDTGMGLERAAAVLQGKASVYETDLFAPIIERVCQLSGKTYGVAQETDYALRVVAEHARAAAFLIGDGVVPGNEGRGYVLRRIIRRAIRHGRRLGLSELFLAQVAEVAIQRFGHAYGELTQNREFILRVVRLEEERFGRTIQAGTGLLEEGLLPFCNRLTNIGWNPLIQAKALTGHITTEARQEVRAGIAMARAEFETWFRPISLLDKAIDDLNKTLDASDDPPEILSKAATLSGPAAFLLWDTYGFPAELTTEIAQEYGLDGVDMEGFQREMEAQRERARAAHAFTGGMEILPTYEGLSASLKTSLGVERTRFVGYAELERQTVVVAVLVDASSASGGSGQMVPAGHVSQGQRVEVVLRETPFYPEGGGQVGDRGTITGPNGVVTVEDTQSPVAGLIVHRGVVELGSISEGDQVTAQVDVSRRLDSARNHSGTHLLHASLRAVLGPHVRQAGSLVAPERLRFDFSHVSPLAPEELRSVQRLANERIRDNLKVSAQETTYSSAVAQGALAFFGDRYGDVVRVVSMSDPAHPGTSGFSLEVCGGTHVAATGQVGTLFVLGESSIGGGMRRIEAVTGRAAEQLFAGHAARLESLSRKLQTPLADLEVRLDSFLRDTEELKRRLASLERAALRSEAERMLGRVVVVDGVKVVAARTSAASAEAMREMGDFLKARLSSAVVVLSAVINGSPMLVAMVTPDLVDRGLHAGNVARDAARVMGGSGGGRPELAQAGGKQAEKLDEALRLVPDLVRRGLSFPAER